MEETDSTYLLKSVLSFVDGTSNVAQPDGRVHKRLVAYWTPELSEVVVFGQNHAVNDAGLKEMIHGVPSYE